MLNKRRISYIVYKWSSRWQWSEPITKLSSRTTRHLLALAMSNSTFFQPPIDDPWPKPGPGTERGSPTHASFYPRTSTPDPNLKEHADNPVFEAPVEGKIPPITILHTYWQLPHLTLTPTSGPPQDLQLQLPDGIDMDLDRPMVVNIHLKILDAAFTRQCTIIPGPGLDPLTYSSKLPAGLSLRQNKDDSRTSCSCNCQCKSRGNQREPKRGLLKFNDNDSDRESLQSDETPRSAAGVDVSSPPSIIMTLWNLHGPPPGSSQTDQAPLDFILREALSWYIRATERIKCVSINWHICWLN